MKRSIAFLLVFFTLSQMVYASGMEVKKKAGEFNVEIEMDNNPPVVGKNNITVEIKDKNDAYVKDAKVRVDYSMPAMPGMPPMDYKQKASINGDKYEAVLDLTMAGPWNVVVKFKRPGGKLEKIKFSFDAR